MDALSDVLRVMRLKGGVFLYGMFRDPWCLSVEVEPQSCAPYLGETACIIPYHFVLDGRMRVRMPDGFEFELEAGDSVLFPRNDDHLLGSDLERPPVDGASVVQPGKDGGLATIVLGEDGAETRIICGFLGAEDIRGNPVVSALPAALRLDGHRGRAAEWVRSTLHFAANQVATGTMGSEAVMGKLSELLFVEAIQRYVQALPEQHTGWLAGLKDPYVSRAMALLHARIADPWTVDALGREIGLSRSALADRFARVLGMPPMQYLANWRIHVAAHELVNSGKSIPQIARSVGYDSEASFTRAFKRLMDTPPAAWRRERR
jgi:AraC-like DNA-binding protein